MAHRLNHSLRQFKIELTQTDADLRKVTEISRFEDAPTHIARASGELTHNRRRLTHECAKVARKRWFFALRQFKIELTQTDAATGRLTCASSPPRRGWGNLALRWSRHPARKLIFAAPSMPTRS